MPQWRISMEQINFYKSLQTPCFVLDVAEFVKQDMQMKTKANEMKCK